MEHGIPISDACIGPMRVQHCLDADVLPLERSFRVETLPVATRLSGAKWTSDVLRNAVGIPVIIQRMPEQEDLVRAFDAVHVACRIFRQRTLAIHRNHLYPLRLDPDAPILISPAQHELIDMIHDLHKNFLAVFSEYVR